MDIIKVKPKEPDSSASTKDDKTSRSYSRLNKFFFLTCVVLITCLVLFIIIVISIGVIAYLDLVTKLDTTEREVISLKALIDQLNSTNSIKNDSTNIDLASISSDVESIKQDLTLSLNSLGRELSEVRGNISSSLATELNDAREMILFLNASQDILRQELNETYFTFDAIAAQVNDTRFDLESLNSSHVDLGLKHTSLDIRHNMTISEVDALATQLSLHQSELESLNSRLNSTVLMLTSQFEGLQTRIQLELTNNTVDRLTASIERALISLNQSQAESVKSLDARLNTAISSHRRNISRLDREVSNLNDALTDHESDEYLHNSQTVTRASSPFLLVSVVVPLLYFTRVCNSCS